jgi:hypothetical protein
MLRTWTQRGAEAPALCVSSLLGRSEGRLRCEGRTPLLRDELRKHDGSYWVAEPEAPPYGTVTVVTFSSLEPAKTAHSRRIEGQQRSFDLTCEGSSRSGICTRVTSNNPCLGVDERERAVGNVEKSGHTVAVVASKNKRFPVAVKRVTATSPTSVNPVPAFATPPGTPCRSSSSGPAQSH